VTDGVDDGFGRCVPLYSFDYIYDYLLGGNMSYVDW
jgi:hypothetical protein